MKQNYVSQMKVVLIGMLLRHFWKNMSPYLVFWIDVINIVYTTIADLTCLLAGNDLPNGCLVDIE